jgi:hypothetical protein
MLMEVKMLTINGYRQLQPAVLLSPAPGLAYNAPWGSSVAEGRSTRFG